MYLCILTLCLQDDFVQEAHLLQAKVMYAMGNYQTALGKYQQIDLEHITVERATDRKLLLIAQSFAIKGYDLNVTLQML